MIGVGKMQDKIAVTDRDGHPIGTAVLDGERLEITLTRLDGATAAALADGRHAVSIGYRVADADDPPICGDLMTKADAVGFMLGRPLDVRERFGARMQLPSEREAAWRRMLGLPCP